MESFEKQFYNLPEEQKKAVLNLMSMFQTQNRSPKNNKELKFDWAGGLEDLKDKYTSVELQHKISEWRAGF